MSNNNCRLYYRLCSDVIADDVIMLLTVCVRDMSIQATGICFNRNYYGYKQTGQVICHNLTTP